MTEAIASEEWVWVVVMVEPDGEHLVGQHQQETDTSYIPFFKSKKEALATYRRLAIEPVKKYEVQAIAFGELCDDAAKNNFALFLLDEDGRILEKITPQR